MSAKGSKLARLNNFLFGFAPQSDFSERGIAPRNNQKNNSHLRDRSCRLRCSLRLKARLQNWHLYFFSGADTAFRGVEVEVEVDGSEVAVAISADAAGMTAAIASYSVAKYV